MTKPTSLETLFKRKQITIIAGVLIVGISIIIGLLSTFAQYMDDKRLLLLAQSIESQALIAKSPTHLQHALNKLIYANRAKGIYIFSKSGKVIASSSTISTTSPHRWLISNKATRKVIEKQTQLGLFGAELHTKYGHKITIFPLSPALEKGFNNNIYIEEKWPAPEWHKLAEIPQLNPSLMAKRLRDRIFNKSTSQFKLASPLYSGVIVIESSNDWISKLLFRSALLFGLLMIIGIFIVNYSLSRAIKRYILDNIKPFSKVINARKNGDTEARIKLSNVKEFDELANQWNSLLDYRQTAQSQNLVLSSLLEHVPVGIEVSDAQSRIEYANPAFLKMTGLSLINVIGQKIDNVLKVAKPNTSIIGDALVALSNGESWSGEISTIRPDETEMHCFITVVPVFGENSAIDRIITLYHDITEIKANENELVSAKVSAELAAKSKSEFIANMSHELRTPLNAIIGFSEMMAAEKMGPLGNKDYIEFSKLIENSSRSLLSTINTILELSRLDADVQKIDKQTISPSRVIDKVINTKVDRAHALGVEISRDLNYSGLIHTDERLLRQSLSYLLCNAIRYNKETGGNVIVSTSLNENNQFIICVKDDGIGISQDDLQHIMSPFHRVDNGFDRANNGSGLGLTLVKKFSSAQNIELSIESELNIGTTVTLTFASQDTRKRNPAQSEQTQPRNNQAKTA